MSKLYLVLGNIGSGKSSVTATIIAAESLSGVEYVGEDVYKKAFFNEGELKSAYKRAKVLVSHKIDNLISRKKSFITEFVPSAEQKFEFVKRAKAAGYEIVVFYLGTNFVSTNVDRVVNRISQGADFVSEAKIAKRKDICIGYFDLICKLADVLMLVDNSSHPKVFGHKIENTFTFYSYGVPQWFKAVAKKLEKSYKIIYQNND